jgi:hypothetical protein
MTATPSTAKVDTHAANHTPTRDRLTLLRVVLIGQTVGR